MNSNEIQLSIIHNNVMYPVDCTFLAINSSIKGYWFFITIPYTYKTLPSPYTRVSKELLSSYYDLLHSTAEDFFTRDLKVLVDPGRLQDHFLMVNFKISNKISPQIIDELKLDIFEYKQNNLFILKNINTLYLFGAKKLEQKSEDEYCYKAIHCLRIKSFN